MANACEKAQERGRRERESKLCKGPERFGQKIAKSGHVVHMERELNQEKRQPFGDVFLIRLIR